MKNVKETLKAMPVGFLILFTIYLAFSNTKDWETIAIVAGVLMLVVQLFYKPFHLVKISNKYAVEFDGDNKEKSDNLIERLILIENNLKRQQKRNDDLSEKINKINAEIRNVHSWQKHTEGILDNVPRLHKLTLSEMFDTLTFTNNISEQTKIDYRSMSGFEEFTDLVKRAHQSKQSLENIDAYKVGRKVYTQAITEKLIDELNNLYSMEKMRPLIKVVYEATSAYPYRKKVLLSVQDELISKYDNKAKATMIFEKAISKLDMLY